MSDAMKEQDWLKSEIASYQILHAGAQNTADRAIKQRDEAYAKLKARNSVRDTATVSFVMALGALLLRVVGAICDETLAAAIYWPGMTTLGVWIISHARAGETVKP